ncbi:MAG TPA: hypothetical protein VGA18_03910, partial [Rhodothermales bacterium]
PSEPGFSPARPAAKGREFYFGAKAPSDFLGDGYPASKRGVVETFVRGGPFIVSTSYYLVWIVLTSYG